MPGDRLTLRRLAGTARAARRARAAVRAAGRIRTQVVVCWDLDNTLVDSGTLVRNGVPVARAWLEADAVPGMLELAAAVRDALPDAGHVVLSVRDEEVRAPTLDWLARRGFAVEPDAVWLVTRPSDKPAVWRRLKGRARLAVVDDLTANHERPEPTSYDDLVAAALSIADVYVGQDEIRRLRANPSYARESAAAIAARLR